MAGGHSRHGGPGTRRRSQHHSGGCGARGRGWRHEASRFNECSVQPRGSALAEWRSHELAHRLHHAVTRRHIPQMLLVIDNYDSFTYNLVQYLGELGETLEIRRNDAIRVEEIAAMQPD